ncbi:acetyl-CoA C-acetyltransferase [Nocardioides sp. WS12]|uniref:acetyl-CoA C-acetyltransferase n=1 Tax=Nocardioides sp. WS12 TaxID=2486272 RepID=UPI0015FB6382|nr:acetyl-CoA C-acetyltransferase [Nocardioides sp. WS12]
MEPALPHAPTVIVGGARTPTGRFLGALKDLSATDLAAVAIRRALETSGLQGADVDHLILGQVLQAGSGQNPARTAGLKAGLPAHIPSITINKVCLSGINAIATADQMIRAGDADIVIAGGTESMSNSPHILPRSRDGFRYGEATLVDSMAYDALYDQATQQGMGSLAEGYNCAHGNSVSRTEQDRFAAQSHQRAAAAQAKGLFDDEIAPVSVPQRNGDPVLVTMDQGVRADTTVEELSALRPAFWPNGTITAGSSSQISDGAAVVVVASAEAASKHGLPVLAEILSLGQVAGPDSSLQLQPANAIKKALEKASLTAADLDLIELNEAFALIGIESSRALGVPEAKTNVNGGAIAIGHPLGASGARITLHLALELARRGGGLGAAALCGGGGQGDALILRVPHRANV